MELYDHLAGASFKGHLYIAKEKLARSLKTPVENAAGLLVLAKSIRARIARLKIHHN